MADQKKRLDSNVTGNFYVDATCINCDTCRQLAPASFEEVGSFSAVTSQPTDEEHLHRAYQALLACPVGSIGIEQSEPVQMQEAMASFPLHLEDGVYYCGFNSEKSLVRVFLCAMCLVNVHSVWIWSAVNRFVCWVSKVCAVFCACSNLSSAVLNTRTVIPLSRNQSAVSP